MPKSKEIISSSGSESGSASSEEEAKQKSKVRKPEKEKKVESSASDNSESEEDTKTKKRPKKQEDKVSNKKARKDSKGKDDDETSWELGGNKHVTVRSFKNKWFVDIREMYMDKDGEMKPGRKGVCLNMENWKSFMKVVEDVDKAVKAKCY
ncbi:hypothetical protein TSAR_016452 [Trichomalopsis sarcophagae]|uniref:Transcriptional coactivator p15 (PC4) C-terminal domain-containing protein n=1 Tax=Trichomalopsis sarcophagae TaxID=543379 RepID=A0A232EX58_9HYME|nr:hypothetical protein TSAR_016452 [Trichomalopsis sarcophagae]